MEINAEKTQAANEDNEDNKGNNGSTDRQQQFRELEAWAQLVGRTLLNMARVFRAEIVLAVTSIPALMYWSVLLIPLLFLSWISFTLFVSWGFYLMLDNSLAAFFIFFVLQIVASGWTVFRIQRLAKRMTFPVSSEQWQQFKEAMQDDRQKTNQENRSPGTTT